MSSVLESPQPPLANQEFPGTHFRYSLSRLQNLRATGRIRSIEKSYNLIGNRTSDLLVCSIMPKPTILDDIKMDLNEMNRDGADFI
jgi:hypothetical protein